MKPLLRDLRWILPASLVLSLVLSLLSPGKWWIGWLAYAIILTPGMMALTALWRSTGTHRTLGIILILTVILRLGLGVVFSFILPPYGNDNDVQNSGYIFRDSYTRDSTAWDLARSSNSLWMAFDRTLSNDQYGGMLFLSGMLYRFLSPESHRPWLVILVGALIAGLGVILAWKGAQKAWGESVAWGTAWIMALYPESILMGSSQMREPFLITFVVMVFWGVVNWAQNWRTSAVWMAIGFIGMMVFNPIIAVAAIIIITVWIWIREKGRRTILWWWIAGGVAVALLAAFIFIGAIGNSLPYNIGPFGNLMYWLHNSASWDAYLMELHSGWLQNVFDSLPTSLHLPFIIGYGITQPVLPAAIADPAVWPMRALGILRGLGWYALLPFLVYSLRSILQISEKRDRFAWIWLWLASWAWIIISAARAGGDQWDNPRYRVILILFQAALAAQALTWQRATHDRLLGRFLAVEGVFLAFFGYWYASRYTNWNIGHVHIFVIIALIVIISIGILAGGWLADRWRIRRA